MAHAWRTQAAWANINMGEQLAGQILLSVEHEYARVDTYGTVLGHSFAENNELKCNVVNEQAQGKSF